MSDESKMCFMTVANLAYQRYIPWFLYFLNRAYPKAHKLILLDVSLQPKIRQMLTLLSGNFEIRERAFPEYVSTSADMIKCLRWLTYEPEFEQYDCMSIGDVDMAIYEESPSYMDQHLAHCDMLGIPYSNFVRPPKSGPARMGGINVFKPREWFVSMRPIMDKYRLMLKNDKLRLGAIGFNEQFLLKMIIESNLGQPPPNLSDTYWSTMSTSNHHGTHIRLAELKGIKGLSGAKGYLDHKTNILAAVETPLFKKLSRMSPQIGQILTVTANDYKNL